MRGEGDTGRKAKMLDDTRKITGGISENKGWEYQQSLHRRGIPVLEVQNLIEHVVLEGNLKRALKRVRSNKVAQGSTGVKMYQMCWKGAS